MFEQLSQSYGILENKLEWAELLLTIKLCLSLIFDILEWRHVLDHFER